MNKEKVLANIQANKDIQKEISKLNFFTSEQFIEHAQRYIKAIKEFRMICSIGHVSSSGMNRSMIFASCEKSKGIKQYSYYYYYCLFRSLGYKESRINKHYFNVSGCGMDMVFHTNYSIIHDLHRLGMITKKECSELAQMTPTVI